MTRPTCSDCLFWTAFPEKVQRNGMGICRGVPPKVHVYLESDTVVRRAIKARANAAGQHPLERASTVSERLNVATVFPETYGDAPLCVGYKPGVGPVVAPPKARKPKKVT